MLTQHLTDQFLRAALGHVTREYPTKLDHVLTGPADLVSQRELHPIFFGSYDLQHSCVTNMPIGCWLACYAAIRRMRIASVNTSNTTITPENVATEVSITSPVPTPGTFEAPLWLGPGLLMLCAEFTPEPRCRNLDARVAAAGGCVRPKGSSTFFRRFTWPVQFRRTSCQHSVRPCIDHGLCTRSP